MDPELHGLVEMGFFATVALGFIVWQYWTVRDAGTSAPKDPGHAEGEHEANDRGP